MHAKLELNPRREMPKMEECKGAVIDYGTKKFGKLKASKSKSCFEPVTLKK